MRTRALTIRGGASVPARSSSFTDGPGRSVLFAGCRYKYLRLLLGGVLMFGATNANSSGIRLSYSLYMGTWSPFATFYELSTPVCVWTDDASTVYKIVAADAEQAGSFDLENDTGNTLPFTVEWQDDFNALLWDVLQADIASSDTYLFDTAEDCSGDSNTAMRITVDKSDFDNAAAGVYTGSIVLTLLPQ